MAGKKAPKVEALVVNAIRRLQDVQGSTPREISNYISQEYDVPGLEIKKQVQLALKRGVSYGILQRSKGGYYSCNRDFLAKQPMETGDVEMKCRPRRKRLGCKSRSRKSRRRRASGCARRSRRRRASRCARKARRRSCKRVRRRSGCKPRRRSSRKRCGSRRSKRRRSRRRRGKRCSSGGMIEMDAIISKQSPKRRDDSVSRNESQSDGSSVSGSSDNRQMDNQDPQSITPPITHMD